MHTLISQKNTYPPTSLCIASLFRKKNMCVFYYTKLIWSREPEKKLYKKNLTDVILSKYFFWTDSHYSTKLWYFSMIQWQHSEYSTIECTTTTVIQCLSPPYIYTTVLVPLKNLSLFFTFRTWFEFFRPIYYYKRLSPVWRILLMIWIWQESLGKPPSPPPSLLADFLISLDENYYSSSSSRGTAE